MSYHFAARPASQASSATLWRGGSTIEGLSNPSGRERTTSATPTGQCSSEPLRQKDYLDSATLKCSHNRGGGPASVNPSTA